MTDKLDTEAIRERCEAATPGPWEMRNIEPEEYDAVTDEHFYIMAPMWEIANITTWERIVEPGWSREADIADATFIAHARADIPALLDELTQLRELYADRERDLAFEHAGRMKAEAEVERLREDNANLLEINTVVDNREAQLNSDLIRLRAALNAVEWKDMGYSYHACPWCDCLVIDGHRADCQRQLALGMAP